MSADQLLTIATPTASETPVPDAEVKHDAESFACDEKAVGVKAQALSADVMSAIKRFVQNLVQLNIKAVMFDFDQTIITTHSTGVVLSNDIPTLSARVTPTFIVMACLLHDANIAVTVGTFSDPAVAEAWNRSVGPHDTRRFVSGPDMVARALAPYMSVPREDIVGYNPDDHKDRPEQFKQYHLQTLAERHGGLQPSEMAIVDDDPRNVNDAAAKGYAAYWVSKRKGMDMATLETIFEPSETPDF